MPKDDNFNYEPMKQNKNLWKIEILESTIKYYL